MSLLLTAVTAVAQTRLYVEDFTSVAGKETTVPIYLENSSEVVGMQFDITLPYDKSSSSPTLISSRANGHSVSLRKLSNTKYTVVVMSMQNNALKGNSGLILRFPIGVPSGAQADDTKAFSLTNIVLTNKQGQNIADERENNAIFTVQRVPTPDLTVDNLSMTGTDATLVPGGKLNLKYDVVNIGNAETGDGWKENIYLVDATGYRSFVGTQTYAATLGASETAHRSVAIDLPQVARTDGTVRAVVEIVDLAKTGELIADQGNNTATSEVGKELERRLFVSPARITMEEGSSQRITVTRSGSWAMDETFDLSEVNETGEKLINIPTSVTIKANSSAATFNVTSIDNTEVNQAYRTNVKVDGTDNDYGTANVQVNIDDNDKYPLTLTTDKRLCDENEELTLTVTIDKVRDEDLKVNVSNTATSRFYPYIRIITIPAGSLSASATTKVVDNAIPEDDAVVTFTASATGFYTSTSAVTVRDNDWPKLTMTLTPNVISEGDGYYATTAILKREGDLSANIGVWVEANNGELYFDSQRNTFPVGKSTIEIPVSVKDNTLQDGDRTHTLTAYILSSDKGTKATAGSPSVATAQLTVTDDDTESKLKMLATAARIEEGSGKVTVTLERNNTNGDLAINLTADDSRLQFPGTVTIPNGQMKVTFEVSAKGDEEVGNSAYCQLTAKSGGYTTATYTFQINDAVIADLTVTDFTIDGSCLAGDKVPVTATLLNQGNAAVKAGVEVWFYLSTDQSIRNTAYYTSPMTKLATYVLQEPLAPGASVPMSVEMQLTDGIVGQYYAFAWADREIKIDDANYSNDMCATKPLKVNPPYKLVEVSADKASYSVGEDIVVSGVMKPAADGKVMENLPLHVILRDASGNQRSNTVKLAEDGSFTTTFNTTVSYGGTYRIYAGISEDFIEDGKSTLKVWNLKPSQTYYQMTLTDGVPFESDLEVDNLAPEMVRNVRLTAEGFPEGWSVMTDAISQLGGGASGMIHFTVTPQASQDQAYKEATLHLTANDETGNEVCRRDIMVHYYAYAKTCKLTSDQHQGIKTSVSKGGERTIELKVRNSGLLETGTVTVTCPTKTPWLTSKTATLVSIDPDQTATFQLTIKGMDDLLVDGKYESNVSLKPENGTAIVIPISMTMVSTNTGKLTVDVVDQFTLAQDDVDGPHVKDANVRLTNALTGAVVNSGKTDADGHFTVAEMQEGTYYVYVTADNHNYAEKTIVVNPGMDNDLQVFLPYKAVNISYTVEETTVVDEYHTVITMDVVPDIPQAIVTPNLPNEWGCGQKTVAVRLTNKGRLTAYNPYFEFPIVDGYTFSVKSPYPDVLYPGESADVTLEFNGQEDKEESVLAGIKMHYGYKLRGEMYGTSETYVAKLGCEGYPMMLAGGGLPSAREPKNLGKDNSSMPTLPKVSADNDENGSTDMPHVQKRDYTQSSDNRVTLQFEQKFFLARQAFKGRLTVENAQMDEISHITIVPTVKTVDGKDATHLFAIDYKGEGAWAKDENWSLLSNTTGYADVLYVPSKETAPTEKTDYIFGGTLTYRDENTAQLVTVELMQTRLTVNPSPDLHLTYFIQRDFMGDDPATPEVEPSVPAEFGLLIQNKGAGDALDLKVETSEPQIVDNKNNLPVEFTALYSTIDGKPGNYKFDEVELGKIPAGGSVMAHWWFSCNVSAHVAYYDVQMTKASNWGEEFNLMTLEPVKELTRSVCGSLYHQGHNNARSRVVALNTSSNIYLINEIEDEENLPDYIMDDKGNGTDDLEIVSSSMTVEATDDENVFTMTVDASREGWVYGIMHDPTNGTKQLVKVVRESDGTDITANFWQTDRKVNADYSVVKENNLHFADNMGTSETYRLVFEPKPEEVNTADVNKDSSINILDVVATLSKIKGVSNYTGTDVNGDGKTDILDAIKILETIKNNK